MNILSFSYKNKKGGFNKRLNWLQRSLIDRKHRLHLLATESSSLRGVPLVQHIIHVPFSKQENLVFWTCFMISSIIKSATVSRREKIDVIITFGPFYTALCFLPIILCKTRAVTFVRADNMKHSENLLRNFFFYAFDWLGLKLSARIVVASSVLKEIYHQRYGIPADRIHVQPNNIEKQFRIESSKRAQIRRSMKVDDADLLISTMGAFNTGKNFALAVSALGRLRHPRLKLVIVGDEVVPTGEKERLVILTRQMHIEESVIFCGWQDDPSPIIASTDLFVYPSRYEGSPNALLEALGCGVPCLGSRIPEIEEILCYDELLFSMDDPEELSVKLGRALSDRPYLSRLSVLCDERAKAFVFDWGKSMSDHITAVKGIA